MDRTRPPLNSDWELVRDAGNAASPTHRQSRDAVTVRYYGAIFAYVKQTGRSQEESRELTQGFIADVLLGRDLLAKVDTRRGQFCTLLMHAVRNYVNDRFRHDHAAKRHPGENKLSALEQVESVRDTSASRQDPESAFHREWIRCLIHDAAESLRREQLAAQRDWAWDIFQCRILDPMLHGNKPPPYEALMERWNLATAAQVANTIVRMRHAFVKHLLQAVGSTVDTPEEARAELRRLLLTIDRSAT